MDKETNKDFFEKVYEIVRKIPAGKVTTYGLIARAIGIRSSARTVGWALNSLAKTNSGRYDDVPAHRVVNRNGDLSGKMHFETPNMMKEMLKSEGVKFKGDRVDLNEQLWKPEI